MLNWAIYADNFSTSKMREIWSENSTISAWIQAEQALARSQADNGVIPESAAKEIESLSISDIDSSALIEDIRLVGRPIVGLVKQLRSAVSQENAQYVHYNSSTQDILDTSSSIQMRQGISEIMASVDRVCKGLEQQMQKHDDVEMLARTNGQHALPIKFCTKLRLWRDELKRRKTALEEASKRGLMVQVGGPLGDLRKYEGNTGPLVKSKVAELLQMNFVEPHWQNARDGVSDIVSALGSLCATLCKISHNASLLSSSDIGELSETYRSGKGASSSMSHKKNQRASEFGEAVARLGRQRAEQIGETAVHEHERSGGVWIAEWVIVPDTFMYTSGALMWVDRLLQDLEVHKEVMEAKVKIFCAEYGDQHMLPSK